MKSDQEGRLIESIEQQNSNLKSAKGNQIIEASRRGNEIIGFKSELKLEFYLNQVIKEEEIKLSRINFKFWQPG